MRPTERTRTPEVEKPRPAVRAFSRRDLLLTTWTERAKMNPGDQVKFAYDRMQLEMSLYNAGSSIWEEAAAESAAVDAEKNPGRTPVPAKMLRRRMPVRHAP